jgi:putative ABC transport system permease protein
MIGIITYVSVVERTKEIGVLRSLGARKKDVSRMFNAETFIIGLFSGLIGVTFTYLISIPINLILSGLITNMTSIATLNILDAVVLVAISFVLTIIAGIIPSRSAAKKDPVVALRTE